MELYNQFRRLQTCEFVHLNLDSCKDKRVFSSDKTS